MAGGREGRLALQFQVLALIEGRQCKGIALENSNKRGYKPEMDYTYYYTLNG